jgi:hypothetical protein
MVNWKLYVVMAFFRKFQYKNFSLEISFEHFIKSFTNINKTDNFQKKLSFI